MIFITKNIGNTNIENGVKAGEDNIVNIDSFFRKWQNLSHTQSEIQSTLT